jgi:phosphopantothenoylcysteine decarboxylase / phosphopantothenate---cysteine ligase
MGYAIANSCQKQGAKVILVSGPVSVSNIHPDVEIIPVTSAQEMYEALINRFEQTDVAIMAAAVADFTPEIVHSAKVKRGKNDLVIRLKPTKDIAAELGKLKKDNQLLIGFALETDNELDNALSKLKRKNLDAIVLNSLNDKGAGFGTDTNLITIIDKNNIIDKFELKSKKDVADDIVAKIIRMQKND